MGRGTAFYPVILAFALAVTAGGASARELTVAGVTIEMVALPGGSFEMGDVLREGSQDEGPAHNVFLPPFSLSKFEVTQRLWTAVMGSNPSFFRGDDQPVECVSWKDCQLFLARLNQVTGLVFRLPTEAEWEYAAREGGLPERYSGSLVLEEVGIWGGNSGKKTHPVGSKKPNSLGLCDMSGNVWEWCSDWYRGDWYGQSPEDDPQGPSAGEHKVCRGGGWYSAAHTARCSYRDSFSPEFRSQHIGLRLASDD